MKSFIDNTLLKNLILQKNKDYQELLLEACHEADVPLDSDQMQPIYYWPTLLTCLNLESLFDNFFQLDEEHELFKALIITLNRDLDEELLMRLYDQLFVECLTHVKNLPEIDAAVLLEKIKLKKEEISTEIAPLVLPLLDYYETYLSEHRAHAMHNLILFLAWDRMCVNMAKIFEYDSASTIIRPGLNILRACLLESFQHITTQNRTSPSLFRLLEALYADEMRQENLDVHSEEGWSALCQGVRGLRSREELADVFYIDEALTTIKNNENNFSDDTILKVLTAESLERVESTLILVGYLMERIRAIDMQWPYILRPTEVVGFIPFENGYRVNRLFTK